MPETPLANAPEARTETGEIKDVSQTTTPTQTQDSTTETEQSQTQQSGSDIESKTEPDGTTLLTKKEDEAPTPTEGAPEKYADFKLPEGIELKGEQLEAATKLFKDLNLSQDAAQSLVDFHSTQLKAAATAGTETMNTMRSDWQATVKADPEIGSRLPAVKAEVSRALDSLNNPALVTEFKAAMDLTGVGDNPAFIKTFYKMAQALNEGRPVSGKGPSPLGQTPSGTQPKPTPAQALYPNLPSAHGSG